MPDSIPQNKPAAAGWYTAPENVVYTVPSCILGCKNELESEIAKEVCQKATEDDLEKLRNSIRRQERFAESTSMQNSALESGTDQTIYSIKA